MRDEGLPLIGRSPAMQEVYRTLARLVDAPIAVLIAGEPGTGKSLTARALHDLGPRRDAPFVTARFGGLSAERVDAAMLGEDGLLARADGGTLFLDEVGDLTPDAQARLAPLVEASERPAHPVTGRRLDMRVLACCGADLDEAVRDGRFRLDLQLRLAVAQLRLPPLRERVEDIGDLARAFLYRAHRDGAPAKTLDEGALQRLGRHPWSGNVRELENLMRRLAVLHTEDLVSERMVEHELAQAPAPAAASTGAPEPALSVEGLLEQTLSPEFGPSGADLPPSGLYDRTLESVERPLIRMTLKATRGNQIRAAEVLGINRNTLRKKIEVLGLEVARRRL